MAVIESNRKYITIDGPARKYLSNIKLCVGEVIEEDLFTFYRYAWSGTWAFILFINNKPYSLSNKDAFLKIY